MARSATCQGAPSNGASVASIQVFDAPPPFDGAVLRARILTKVFRRTADGARLYFVEAGGDC